VNQVMMNSPQPNLWLHRWAILTVIVACPLLFLGAEVTTMGVGMVDPQGLRSPWYFFQEFLGDRGLDWKIEHGHRQVGWLVGNCVIVLTVLTWWLDRRAWVRYLSLAVLVAVCTQGGLGIFRIQLNAILGKTLALIHGCFAQLVFALLATMAVVTSPRWARQPVRATAATDDAPLKRWSLIATGLVYLQLVLGGLVRHQDFAPLARGHLIGAFVVLATVLWLAKLAHDSESREEWMGTVKLLLALVAVQILLGIETWLSKFFLPQAPWNQLQPLAMHQDIVRSIHYVVGTMVFATTVATALRVHRQTLESPACNAAANNSAQGLEGAA
jgi:heme a synthase